MSEALQYLKKCGVKINEHEIYSCNIMKKVYGEDVRSDYQDKMRPPYSKVPFVWLYWYNLRLGLEKTNELRVTLMALYEEAFLNEH